MDLLSSQWDESIASQIIKIWSILTELSRFEVLIKKIIYEPAREVFGLARAKPAH
jgi:hypothetical protein